MKQYEIRFNYTSLTMRELNVSDRELVERAKEACNNSYAPYSHFHVGVAVRLKNDCIVIGNNQENASYPAGLCAERVALFSAGAQYDKIPVVAMAIAAKDRHGYLVNPIQPCGGCRQVMVETENRYHTPMRVLLYGTSRVYVIEKAADLLPLSFGSSMLGDGVDIPPQPE